MWEALTPMRVLTPVSHRTAVGQSAASRFLEGLLQGLILAVTVGDISQLTNLFIRIQRIYKFVWLLIEWVCSFTRCYRQ